MAHDQLYDGQVVKVLDNNVTPLGYSPPTNRALYNKHAVQFSVAKVLSEVVTFTNVGDLVNAPATAFLDNDTLQFTLTGGALPAELSVGVTYHVINQIAGSFQVSLTQGGAAVTFTDDGSAVVNAVANGPGPGTLLVEGSLNGVDWVTIAAAQVSTDILQITDKYQWIRLRRANDADVVTAWIAGFDANIS